jgi:hypothetical protein
MVANMNELKNILKNLNVLHANAGNVTQTEQRDLLTMLYSAQFTINHLIALFGGVK